MHVVGTAVSIFKEQLQCCNSLIFWIHFTAGVFPVLFLVYSIAIAFVWKLCSRPMAHTFALVEDNDALICVALKVHWTLGRRKQGRGTSWVATSETTASIDRHVSFNCLFFHQSFSSQHAGRDVESMDFHQLSSHKSSGCEFITFPLHLFHQNENDEVVSGNIASKLDSIRKHAPLWAPVEGSKPLFILMICGGALHQTHSNDLQIWRMDPDVCWQTFRIGNQCAVFSKKWWVPFVQAVTLHATVSNTSDILDVPLTFIGCVNGSQTGSHAMTTLWTLASSPHNSVLHINHASSADNGPGAKSLSLLRVHPFVEPVWTMLPCHQDKKFHFLSILETQLCFHWLQMFELQTVDATTFWRNINKCASMKMENQESQISFGPDVVWLQTTQVFSLDTDPQNIHLQQSQKMFHAMPCLETRFHWWQVCIQCTSFAKGIERAHQWALPHHCANTTGWVEGNDFSLHWLFAHMFRHWIVCSDHFCLILTVTGPTCFKVSSLCSSPLQVVVFQRPIRFMVTQFLDVKRALCDKLTILTLESCRWCIWLSVRKHDWMTSCCLAFNLQCFSVSQHEVVKTGWIMKADNCGNNCQKQNRKNLIKGKFGCGSHSFFCVWLLFFLCFSPLFELHCESNEIHPIIILTLIQETKNQFCQLVIWFHCFHEPWLWVSNWVLQCCLVCHFCDSCLVVLFPCHSF